MIISTTNHVDGYQVVEYMRVISGETIFGMNAWRDLGASIRNIIGGRAEGWEQEVASARETALSELFERGQQLGADAVIGVKLDFTAMGTDNGMVMVTATGTAVRLAPSI
ncbi:MAG: heavy metal-binding domain-containing protein [Corynebacterium sp.]|nr:heavy metal-binding domain-containing protein [Corynebacterium sp.]